MRWGEEELALGIAGVVVVAALAWWLDGREQRSGEGLFGATVGNDPERILADPKDPPDAARGPATDVELPSERDEIDARPEWRATGGTSGSEPRCEPGDPMCGGL